MGKGPIRTRVDHQIPAKKKQLALMSLQIRSAAQQHKLLLDSLLQEGVQFLLLAMTHC